jgi:hypothetical protein
MPLVVSVPLPVTFSGRSSEKLLSTGEDPMEQHMDPTTTEPSQSDGAKPPRQDRMRRRWASWLAWALWLLVVAGGVVAFTLTLLNGRQAAVVAIVDWWTGTLPFLAFATVGALILSRRPHNAIGWLCWTMGAVVCLGSVGFEAARRVADDPVSGPVALVLLVGSATFLVSLLGLLPLLVLVFPTGRLPSRRWRAAVGVFAGGLVLYLGLFVLQPGPMGDGLPANPLGVSAGPSSCWSVSDRSWACCSCCLWSWCWSRWSGAFAEFGAMSANSSSGSPTLRPSPPYSLLRSAL